MMSGPVMSKRSASPSAGWVGGIQQFGLMKPLEHPICHCLPWAEAGSKADASRASTSKQRLPIVRLNVDNDTVRKRERSRGRDGVSDSASNVSNWQRCCQFGVSSVRAMPNWVSDEQLTSLRARFA